MDQQVIRTLADDDMQAVNQLIYQRLQSDVALVNQLAYYIISGGGMNEFYDSRQTDVRVALIINCSGCKYRHVVT